MFGGQWQHFWYDLHKYMDASWRNSVETLPQGLFHGESSDFLWRAAFPLWCQALSLTLVEPSYCLEEKRWQSILPILVKNRPKVLSLTALALSREDLALALNRHKALLSVEDIRSVMQWRQSLSLPQRIEAPLSTHQGLWLLCHSVKSNFPIAWQRLRLAFPLDEVMAVESVPQPWSAMTHRSVQRLWQMMALHLEKSIVEVDAAPFVASANESLAQSY